MTAIILHHFLGLESKHSQNGSFEYIPSWYSHRCGHTSGIDKNKMICHIKARFTLNRTECFRAIDPDLSEYRVPGEQGYYTRVDIQVDIPLNTRCLG